MEDSVAQRLLRLARHDGGERVRLDEVLAAVADKGFGLMVLALALPNAIPMPGIPGLSALFGLPLALIALQLALGRTRPMLPRRLGGLAFRRTTLAALVEKALPLLDWLDRLPQPRYHRLTSPGATRVIGVLCLLLALVVSLPIPLGNIPIAFALLLIGIGHAGRDGLLVLAGVGAAWAGLAWNVLVVVAGSQGIIWAAEALAASR